MEREILLPLEREYTDKEKIGLLTQQNQNLIDQLNNGRLVNVFLKNKIGELNRAIHINKLEINNKNFKLQKLENVHKELIFKFEVYKDNMQKTVLNQMKKERRSKHGR